jgi:hypothetical protein
MSAIASGSHFIAGARRVLAGGKIPQPSRCVFMRYRFASRSVSSQAFGVLALFPFETFLAIQKVPDRRPDERVRRTPPKLAQSLQPIMGFWSRV